MHEGLYETNVTSYVTYQLFFRPVRASAAFFSFPGIIILWLGLLSFYPTGVGLRINLFLRFGYGGKLAYYIVEEETTPPPTGFKTRAMRYDTYRNCVAWAIGQIELGCGFPVQILRAATTHTSCYVLCSLHFGSYL